MAMLKNQRVDVFPSSKPPLTSGIYGRGRCGRLALGRPDAFRHVHRTVTWGTTRSSQLVQRAGVWNLGKP